VFLALCLRLVVVLALCLRLVVVLALCLRLVVAITNYERGDNPGSTIITV
jgi:hypothetical protein